VILPPLVFPGQGIKNLVVDKLSIEASIAEKKSVITLTVASASASLHVQLHRVGGGQVAALPVLRLVLPPGNFKVLPPIE
jgi:hypothetical protein